MVNLCNRCVFCAICMLLPVFFWFFLCYLCVFWRQNIIKIIKHIAFKRRLVGANE